ncbi:Coenzyme F420 hydrogenase/dehydrogenase, beta subunit C-terminal domain [Fibrobacter sp.]|uniref:Coenzyme F420 hydrogenase/dehydrogenase, beta subunit C-terminal domain n=1 Tax=Fibrobacter sp. TaxID=35828 RepID=UPI00388FE286
MWKKNPNVSYTVRQDLCTGCGVCQGACPTGALTIKATKSGEFRPIIDEKKCNNSKGCHRCYDSCPGVGVNLLCFAKENFKDEGVQEDKMVGRYLKCFTGYSNDEKIRYHSASGGMITQFLIWLLENNLIDGAVVTKFDNNNALMVSSYIATTRDEVIAARSSKYAPVTLNHAVQDIKNAPGTRYVVVGVPCHVQGFRKMMAMDKRLREKIVGLFAVYCSCGRTFNLTEYVLKERGINRDCLTYFQYRDEGCLGSLKAKVLQKGSILKPFTPYAECFVENGEQVYKEEFQSYYHPLKSFFIPRRCLFCIDHYGELADVSFGDIHIKPYSDDKIGVNSLIVRKRDWLDLLKRCRENGNITLDEVSFETISDSQKMSFKKKGRNGAFLKIVSFLGGSVPKYDVDYLRPPMLRDYFDYMQNRFQQFIGRHKKLWFLIPLLKGKVDIH